MHDTYSSLDSGSIRVCVAKQHGQEKAPHASARPSHEFDKILKRLGNHNYVTGPIKNCPVIEPILTRNNNVSYMWHSLQLLFLDPVHALG